MKPVTGWVTLTTDDRAHWNQSAGEVDVGRAQANSCSESELVLLGLDEFGSIVYCRFVYNIRLTAG